MKSSLRRRGTGAKLGQHFLTSRAAARRIAIASGANQGATILEVGPGKGFLTRELLALGARVIAVEKDPDMVHLLTETFRDEIVKEQLHLILGDARDVLNTDSSSLITGSYSVAANIPYYITGELIRLFLTAPRQPQRVALLVQKEVAERIARNKKESLLSLSVKVYGTPWYLQTVKAGSFSPPPKVDSAILLIEGISRKSFHDINEMVFFELLHAGFGQKRKTLLGNLKRARTKNRMNVDWDMVWHTLELNVRTRAEDVSLPVWLSLAKHIT